MSVHGPTTINLLKKQTNLAAHFLFGSNLWGEHFLSSLRFAAPLTRSVFLVCCLFLDILIYTALSCIVTVWFCDWRENKAVWAQPLPHQQNIFFWGVVQKARALNDSVSHSAQKTLQEFVLYTIAVTRKTSHATQSSGIGQWESLCSRHICARGVSGKAVFSAITAGQSSVASWVSIGHSSTVHYHMGVAMSLLLEKCFQ